MCGLLILYTDDNYDDHGMVNIFKNNRLCSTLFDAIDLFSIF